MDDRKLIEEIQRGKKEYLNDLASKYYDDIYRFCCYRTGDLDGAYDLAQETFLRFIRYVDRYQYRNLKGYLLTIAMNVCRDYFRGKCEDRWELWEEGAAEEKMPEEEKDLSDTAVKIELSGVIWNMLAKLPGIQREVIILHCYYGFKHREIGQMLGVKTATVKSRMKQGTDKLRKWLPKEEYDEG